MRIIFIILLVFLCGCSMMDLRQQFFGMYPSDVLNAKHKYTKVFDAEPSFCYDRTLEILRRMQANIEQENRSNGLIVADRFDRTYQIVIDATKLGIVIRPYDTTKSEIFVYSGNYDLSQFVSEALFKGLEDSIKSRHR